MPWLHPRSNNAVRSPQRVRRALRLAADQFGNVAHDKSLPHGLFETSVQNHVVLFEGGRREPPGLLAVILLEIDRFQLLQPNGAEFGTQMVVNDSLVGVWYSSRSPVRRLDRLF